jgi:hypothetical protein
MSRRRRADVTVLVRAAPGGTPLAMRVRRLWPDRNPLRRASDMGGTPARSAASSTTTTNSVAPGLLRP